MAENKENQKESDDKILGLAKSRYKQAVQAVQEIRKKGIEDVEFLAGDQWPADVRKAREEDGRPVITINKSNQFVNQITNDQRQNRPQTKVSPVDDKADVATAKVIQGLMRHIWTNSDADTAIDTAFDGSVGRSYGFFRVITDYANEFSFNQEILIERIRNPESVFLDPFSKKADGSDAEFGFIEEEISKDEFEQSYPDAELSKGWRESLAQKTDWVTDNSCKVLEYFYKHYEETEINLMSDGSVLTTEELNELSPAQVPIGFDDAGAEVFEERNITALSLLEAQGVTIKKTRVTNKTTVKWCKLVDNQILEKKDFPSKYIPIIPVYGKEVDINGKLILESVIRHAKGSQIAYNYLKSMEAETISLAPRAPYLATPDQIKGFENEWRNANRKNYTVLFHNPVSSAGVPLPPPSRNLAEPPIQAVSQAAMLASEDMKATTGMYDVTLGQRGQQQSGVAIQRANAQSQTSNFHFIDNLSRSIRHLGRVLLDMIPRVYDVATASRIIGEDGAEEIVMLNQPFKDKKTGEERLYDLSVGTYDITIETGPSYATKRQESLASMLELTQAQPQLAAVAGDLMVKNMDWPGATEIAERIKRTMDPKILGEPGQPQVPPEVQMQLEQSQQAIQMLSAQLQDAHQKLQNKALELASKERIESNKIEADLIKKAAELDMKMQMQILSDQLKQVQDWQNQVQTAQEQYLAQQQQIQNQNFNQSGLNGEAGIETNPEQGLF